MKRGRSQPDSVSKSVLCYNPAHEINTYSLHHFGFDLIVGVSPVWATCGGGGGGGDGGVSSGGGNPTAYHVPWRVRQTTDPAIKAGLVVYWFPATVEEVQNSSLRSSRLLTLYASQCVSMELVDYQNSPEKVLLGDSKVPVALLATADGKVINKVENKDGKLRVENVEKLVETEVKLREKAIDATLKDAKEKVKAADNAAAAKLYRSVLDEQCLFPKKAKEATKELKKLGEDVAEFDYEAPVLDKLESARIERTMLRGLRSEIRAEYLLAERLYTRAHLMDPADPVPLRYLGELYRHHTGQWDKARTTFDAILKMPADRLSRAVALHGLGKMTIHDGEFKKGLALMEASIAEFPLALTYRNLAVYWNSEGDPVKGDAYTQQALALDPKDPYNQVFAAVFMAAAGRQDRALKIAQQYMRLLPSSYNLAAIYAQAGQRDKALAYLRRHFFKYERYQAVREKEMMEARVDAVFDSITTGPGLSGADKRSRRQTAYANKGNER